MKDFDNYIFFLITLSDLYFIWFQEFVSNIKQFSISFLKWVWWSPIDMLPEMCPLSKIYTANIEYWRCFFKGKLIPKILIDQDKLIEAKEANYKE